MANEVHTAIDPFLCIKEFHEKFELRYDGEPRTLDAHLSRFRQNFMKEEFDEYLESQVLGDKAGQLDALVDLVYVVLGTAYLQGFDFNEAFRRVHEANMQKVRAKRPEESKRDSAYDVIKPEGWTAPNLDDLVE